MDESIPGWGGARVWKTSAACFACMMVSQGNIKNGRERGCHHLFDKEGIVEIVNLQSRGRHAKPYQVRQVRKLILKYKLGADD